MKLTGFLLWLNLERAANCQRITITKPNSVIANSQRMYPNGMNNSAYSIIGQPNEPSFFMGTNETVRTPDLINSASQLGNSEKSNKKSKCRPKDVRKTADVAIDTGDLTELGKNEFKSASSASNHFSRNIFVLDQYHAPRIKVD